jgi:hypothetical protein
MKTYNNKGVEITNKDLENKLDFLMNDEVEVKTTKKSYSTGRMESETIYTIKCGTETALVSLDCEDIYKNYIVSIFDNRFTHKNKIVEFSNKIEAKKYAFLVYKNIVSKYQKRANMLNKEWKKQEII